MKVKIKMTCILKSGVVVKDTLKISKKDTKAVAVLNRLKREFEDAVGTERANGITISFGTTVIACSEIAAISIRED